MKYWLFFLLFFVPCFCVAQGVSAEATAYFKKAEAAFKTKDLPNAEKLINEALNIEPDNAYYRYVLGQIQFMREDYLTSRENLEIVSRLRPSPDRGDEYNNRLKTSKQKIRDMQSKFNQAGKDKFEVYEKNKNSSNALRVAVTVFQAFRLNPTLRYKHLSLLEEVISTYEKALQKSFDGIDWQKAPMLQLAFLYEVANQKDKAAEVYMRALDYVDDMNEEFIITHRFDYLNRSNKEKLLDTIEAGEFNREDLQDIIGSAEDHITSEEKEKIEGMIDDARSQLQDASSDYERDQVFERFKESIIEKHKKGELPGQDKLEQKLKEQGKTIEEYWAEQGL